MTIGPITYISINLGPVVGANDFLAGVRVVPPGRNGNAVFGRSDIQCHLCFPLCQVQLTCWMTSTLPPPSP